MPKDSFCIQYTNCTGCPNVNENILVYRNLPKGAHIPKDKCTQNCMLFMIKGELLINSEEYPGNILREKQFILQAILPSRTLNTSSTGLMSYPCFAKNVTVK